MSDRRIRALLLADDCNPEWPSLPIVGYKYALAIAEECDVVVATHVRNRENILKAGRRPEIFEFIDNEHIASPMYKLARWLRGGDEVAWSTNMAMQYLPYLEFERQALKRFRIDDRLAEFDVVHRITPMSPTMPSFAAGRTGAPFIIGPLNGNLDWPPAFREEQAREKEKLRALRSLYKRLPFARSTFRNATAILYSFEHTRADFDPELADKLISFPEIGYDETIFHPPAEARSLHGRPQRFLFVGRLVPYKLPEVAIRAFLSSERLREHFLHVVGQGPEHDRLQAVIEAENAQDRVFLEGATDQHGVAGWMRRCDHFVFPSIRELGAGVVVEAMASGMSCIGVNYGAPGDLLADGRGALVSLESREALIDGFRDAMEACAEDPDASAGRAGRALEFAGSHLTWARKAAATRDVYGWVAGCSERRPDGFVFRKPI